MAPTSPPADEAATRNMFDTDDVNITRYAYKVSKDWLEDHRKYARKKCNKPPGPVSMNCHVSSLNEWTPGELWVYWVEKWGLSVHHELDRRKVDESAPLDFVDCEVAILSPYMQHLQHRTKSFTLQELIGYIECQVRQVLQVPKERNTRLWFAATLQDCNGKDMTKSVPAQLTPCLNRKHRLVEEVPSSSKIHMLVLELQDLNGSWPSGFKTDPNGELTEFMRVHDRHVTPQVWPEVKVAETSVLRAALQQAETLSTQTRHKHRTIEQGLQVKEETLTKLISRHETTRTFLQEKHNELESKEQSVATREDKTEASLRNVIEEEVNFNDQLTHMHQLNKIHADVVLLNVGGQIFDTPLTDLVKYESSLFGKVFSGCYNVHYAPDGTYFIDRDPTYFIFILMYLCEGLPAPCSLPQTKEEIKKLCKEAKYYKLWALVSYLEDIFDGLPSIHDTEEPVP